MCDKATEEYKNDPRIPCRYGTKCYQKNPTHQNKYKHPPDKNSSKKKNLEHPTKKRKLNDESETTSRLSQDTSAEKKECISDSLSESDEEERPRSSNREEHISDSSSNEEIKAETSSKVHEDLSTASDPKVFIKEKFLVEMPSDFFEFWKFCEELKPNNPSHALKDVGLELVGPFDVLAGRFKNVEKSSEDYLRHWRYYYDPPELQTVLRGDDRVGYHIGYFRDSPKELPVFLVGNYGLKDGILYKMGDNIFTAVSIYLDELKKTGDPFKKIHVGRYSTLIKNKSQELQLKTSPHTENIRKREYKVVAQTANKIGLVVPYNKKTQLGYRDLAMTDKEIKVLLSKLMKAAPEQRTKYLSELQPVLTYASIALDECDFGTGLKLGWDFLCHGVEGLNNTILRFLSNSYKLLDREAFAKIAEAHLSKREKGCNLSVLQRT